MKQDIFKLSHYDYEVSAALIAQEPLSSRDQCRLLIVDREKSTLKEGIFSDIVEFLKDYNLYMNNNTNKISVY